MQGFIILAIIGTEKSNLTEVDGLMECWMDGQKFQLLYCALL